MKRNVLIFGAILGTLLCINLFYTTALCYNNPSFESNDALGYFAMMAAFSMTFFGIRNYRNKALDGTISLGRAFKIGALIALAGSTIYLIVWLFEYYLFMPDFVDRYKEHVLIQASRHGATATELASTTKQMEKFKEMYKNPLFVIITTYAEVMPIGLVIAFISALILRKKSPTMNTSNEQHS
jgi:hypothetical protein